MSGTVYTLLVAPLLGWLVGLSLVVVFYLLTLVIKEYRRNRRLDAERRRLGLRPELRSSWQFLL
jgi:hypothetical protein